MLLMQALQLAAGHPQSAAAPAAQAVFSEAGYA